MNITTAPCFSPSRSGDRQPRCSVRTNACGPLADHGEDTCLARELRQLLLVDVVDGGVVGEEARAGSRQLIAGRSALTRGDRDACRRKRWSGWRRARRETPRRSAGAAPTDSRRSGQGRSRRARRGRTRRRTRPRRRQAAAWTRRGPSAPPAEAGRNRQPAPSAGRRTAPAVPWYGGRPHRPGSEARAGSIEISSMISTLVFSMREARRRLVESRSRSRRVRASRTPMPLQA